MAVALGVGAAVLGLAALTGQPDPAPATDGVLRLELTATNGTGKPGSGKPVGGKPGSGQPGSGKPDGGQPGGGQPVTDRSGPGNSPLSVGATAVTGLYPGATRRLELVAHNPYQFPVQLVEVTGVLTGSSDLRCPLRETNIVLGRHAGPPALPVRLAAGQRGAVGHLPVRMPATVVDACQGATFTVRISATATKAKS